MIPMAFFLRWGYVWGHENYWRRVKEVVVTYEIAAGARSKFTMKWATKCRNVFCKEIAYSLIYLKHLI